MSDQESDSTVPKPKQSIGNRIKRWAKRFVQGALIVVLLYGVFLVIGFVPVNHDFEPTERGVPIMIYANAVHADVLVPIANETIDWREKFPAELFEGNVRDATHVAIGWGDKGFYLETPTWADLKLSTAANALILPSDCCLHVQMLRQDNLPANMPGTRVSKEQYQRFVEFVDQTLKMNAAGNIEPIADSGYGRRDLFFEAHGNYTAFYTCNSWAGQSLRVAGIRVPWMTPLPGTTSLYLPSLRDPPSASDAPGTSGAPSGSDMPANP